ncbi:FMN-binding protein [Proteiniclasticum sp.]|uniref:FMN-binding protein n=1 Tax=Proteiniclasticum sp. TaxID=2053595 RepID=UPI002898A0FF|nr:FMN-binding protein [Proteiniclasticum sp.]
MKKIVKIAASALLSVGVLVGCGSTSALKDGTYNGEAQGHNGPIKVTVTVAEGKVSDITVDEHAETEGIWEKAEEAVIPAIVGKTSADDAETVSGATVSSTGIKDAVNKALESAK